MSSIEADGMNEECEDDEAEEEMARILSSNAARGARPPRLVAQLWTPRGRRHQASAPKAHRGEAPGATPARLVAPSWSAWRRHRASRRRAAPKAPRRSVTAAVVLVKAGSGHAFFVKLLEHLRDRRGEAWGILSDRGGIDRFNDRQKNLRGERDRVFVGETGACGEGTSFFNVRRLYLLDAPANATEFEQRVARVDRGDGHFGLPVAERTVTVEIACAVLPGVLRNPLGAWLWRELLGSATALPPSEWKALLQRVERIQEAFEKHLGIDPEDDDALSELRDVVKSWQEVDSNDSGSEAESCHDQQKALKHLRLNKILDRLARTSDEAFRKIAASLCTTTVDEQLLVAELPERCLAVRRAHKPLREVAMNPSSRR
mmetsp:Transcript_16263/g.56744  ORF Transcript_16263/g.56744 Transcript_16263/m.56744 type:complete len:374 (+) Transcript_16263:899-2020(+)